MFVKTTKKLTIILLGRFIFRIVSVERLKSQYFSSFRSEFNNIVSDLVSVCVRVCQLDLEYE